MRRSARRTRRTLRTCPKLNVYASNPTYKTVKYSEIEPMSDGLAYYKGKLYGTKQDLKYFPEKVQLVKFLGDEC